MIILKTISMWLLIILGVIILLLFIFCIVPLKYVFSIKYKDRIFSFVFNFCFINFTLIIGIGTPLTYKAKFLFKVIADSSKKKEEAEKDDGVSMTESDFITDKSVKDEVTIDKHAAKEFLERAKDYTEEINKKELTKFEKEEKKREEIEEKAISFIDSFKKFLPLDLIDALKIMTHEWMGYYRQLLPKKIKTRTEFGIDDPYYVGIILAFISPLYAAYGKNINVTPHFDKIMLDMEIFIIGYPQIIFIIIPLIKMFLNKRFREVIFANKKHEKN